VNITGKITGIKYKLLLSDELREIEVGEVDISMSYLRHLGMILGFVFYYDFTPNGVLGKVVGI
jgi:hypothetical protein